MAEVMITLLLGWVAEGEETWGWAEGETQRPLASRDSPHATAGLNGDTSPVGSQSVAEAEMGSVEGVSLRCRSASVLQGLPWPGQPRRRQ